MKYLIEFDDLENDKNADWTIEQLNTDDRIPGVAGEPGEAAEASSPSTAKQFLHHFHNCDQKHLQYWHDRWLQEKDMCR